MISLNLTDYPPPRRWDVAPETEKGIGWVEQWRESHSMSLDEIRARLKQVIKAPVWRKDATSGMLTYMPALVLAATLAPVSNVRVQRLDATQLEIRALLAPHPDNTVACVGVHTGKYEPSWHCSFLDDKQAGIVQVWNLPPGTYSIVVGLGRIHRPAPLGAKVTETYRTPPLTWSDTVIYDPSRCRDIDKHGKPHMINSYFPAVSRECR